MDLFLPTDNPVLYLLPIIGAAIGWLTNFIAIKMLFHPRKPISLFGFALQGVFPRRQKALARKVGEIVSSELFSGEDIAMAMKKNAKSKEVFETIAQKIEKVLVEKLPQAIPMAAMFLTPELVAAVKDMFVDEINGAIDSIIEKLSVNVTKNLDIHEVVEEKVAGFSSDKLEEILLNIMRKELRFIELVGAVLGFFIGGAQVVLVQVSVF